MIKTSVAPLGTDFYEGERRSTTLLADGTPTARGGAAEGGRITAGRDQDKGGLLALLFAHGRGIWSTPPPPRPVC